jgi:hypothetical protein
MNLAITKPSPDLALTVIPKRNPKPDPDALIYAYWLMFCRAPAKPNPDATGAYWLGEVGQDAFEDQRLLRDTPYSVCKGIRAK